MCIDRRLFLDEYRLGRLLKHKLVRRLIGVAVFLDSTCLSNRYGNPEEYIVSVVWHPRDAVRLSKRIGGLAERVKVCYIK